MTSVMKFQLVAKGADADYICVINLKNGVDDARLTPMHARSMGGWSSRLCSKHDLRQYDMMGSIL